SRLRSQGEGSGRPGGALARRDAALEIARQLVAMRLGVGDGFKQVRVVGEPAPDLREARIAARHLVAGELSPGLLAIQESDDELRVAPDVLGHRVRPTRWSVAPDVRQHLAAVLVDADDAWRSLEPDGLEMPQQRVHRRGPGPCPSAYRVTDAHGIREIAAERGLFAHVARVCRTAGGLRRVFITASHGGATLLVETHHERGSLMNGLRVLAVAVIALIVGVFAYQLGLSQGLATTIPAGAAPVAYYGYPHWGFGFGF